MSKNNDTNTYTHTQFEVQLTTHSPLHIGTGERLSSTGEYFAEGESHIHILDNDKLMKYLNDNGLLRDYIGIINEKGIDLDFVEALDQLSLPANVSTHDLLKSKPYSKRRLSLRVKTGFDVTSNNIMRLHVRTCGEAYLPGSSLKGAIRAAIVLWRLREDKAAMQQFNRLVEQCVETESIQPFSRKISYKAQQNGEMNWDIFEQKYCTPSKQIPDFLRFTDSDTIEDECVCVHQGIRENFYIEPVSNSAELDWLIECIAPDTVLRSRLTFYATKDEPQLAFLGKDKTHALHHIINQHTHRLIEVELQQLQREDIPMRSEKTALRDALVAQLQDIQNEIDQAKDQHAFLRLGMGKPLFFITIAALIDDLDTRQEFMRIALNRDEEADPKQNIIPRTRTLAAHHDERLMLGWTQIQFIVPPKPEVPVPDNQRERIEEQIEIKALVTKTNPKKVAFKINGNLYDDVQYILDRQHKKEPIEVNDIIKVRIHYINQGKIEQVKYVK